MAIRCYYVGASTPCWLGRTETPLMFNRHILRGTGRRWWARRLPRATCSYAIDSNGYRMIRENGDYPFTAREYACEVACWSEVIGRPDFAACMDWTCDPESLARTGLTVRDHQAKTAESYLELRRVAPGLPWMPVIQGWTAQEYMDRLRMYRGLGVDLVKCPLVGIGSVFPHQPAGQMEAACRALRHLGVRLHGFGFKTRELAATLDLVHTADSSAWSLSYYHTAYGTCRLKFIESWHDRFLAKIHGEG